VRQNIARYHTPADVLAASRARADGSSGGGSLSIHGPLPKLIVQSPIKSELIEFGNMLLVEIAGHDTTGNTMTWLFFELARRPEV
jgi:hypothetical protein